MWPVEGGRWPVPCGQWKVVECKNARIANMAKMAIVTKKERGQIRRFKNFGVINLSLAE